MNRSIWVISVLLATLFLLAHWIPGFSATSRFGSPGQPVLAASQTIELSPSERKDMETLALDFTNRYYTYNVDNYLAEGKKLLPLLTKDYQETFKDALEKSFTAAKTANAESSVVSALVMEIEKINQETGLIKVQFKAKVLTHNVETLNRYSTTLELKKENGTWRINAILEEDPVAFSNLKGLL